jgi:Ni/Fe-hydrogenase subunit HybB-like protein
MAVSFGTASILFLVAWHVSTYLTVQMIEISPAVLEWIKSTRVRKWVLSSTIAMTIAGIILSTLHQSALGGMFLLAPGKLHPLWYSSYIPVFFLSSSIYAAMAMVIALSAIAARYLRDKCDDEFLGSLDGLTIGLGKGAAVGMYVYFALKIIGVAHDNHWGLLGTPYGQWFLFELIGFVLLPALIFTYGVKAKSVLAVRFAAFYAVAGILLNRINVSMVAFNWNLPGHLHHMIPPWKEVAVVLAISTIHVLIFRWLLNRLPILREEPGYEPH